MANNVRVTELDFDQIKENLKDYLRNQSQFTDYDFEGSNLSVLIDLLAYNTHYNAVLANMVSNEMFLDTAIKRSSVVSLAKNIGYTPRSVRAARAILDIELTNIPGSPTSVNLDRWKAFTTTIDGVSYTFYNNKSYTATADNGVYTLSGVEVYQGRKLEYVFTVTDATPTAKYVIPNLDIDTTTLTVNIQYAGVAGYSEPWRLVTDVTELDGTSQVFFLQENTQGYYEIFFGDNIIGRSLSPGDTILVTYMISDGANGNVSENVNLTWTTTAIAGETSGDRTITTISNPSGGAEAETTDDIRFYALNNYETQNRAVTKNDYSNILLAQLPGAASVNVWGGEQNIPPEYGKTFISIKPRTGYVLTDAEKNRIINDILKPRSIVSALHEFVDPDFTFITFRITVRYATARTNLNAGQIQTLVTNKVNEFISANLARFNTPFYRSQLEEQIMNINDAILSVNVLFDISKRIPALPGVRIQGLSGFKLPVKIHPNELRTSYFYFTDAAGLHVAQIRDVPDESPPDYEGTGTLKTFDLNTGNILNNALGTVDYGTGEIVLNANSPLTITGYLGNQTQIYVYSGVQESVGDIFPAFNEILDVDATVGETISNVQNGITVNVIADNG